MTVYVLVLDQGEGEFQIIGAYQTLALAQQAAEDHPEGVSGPWEGPETGGRSWITSTKVRAPRVADLWQIAPTPLVVA